MEGRGKGEKTEPRRTGDPGQRVGDPAGRFPDPGVRGRFCPPEAVLAWRLSSDGRQGAFLNRWRGCGRHDGKGDGGNGGGVMNCICGNSSTSPSITGHTSHAGSWRYVVYTFDDAGNSQRMYVDGVQGQTIRPIRFRRSEEHTSE